MTAAIATIIGKLKGCKKNAQNAGHSMSWQVLSGTTTIAVNHSLKTCKMTDKLATIALALAFLTAGAGDSEPALLAILAGLALIFSVASFILK